MARRAGGPLTRSPPRRRWTCRDDIPRNYSTALPNRGRLMVLKAGPRVRQHRHTRHYNARRSRGARPVITHELTRRTTNYGTMPHGSALQAVYIVCRHTMGPLIGFGGETRCGPISSLRIRLMLAVAASSFSIEGYLWHGREGRRGPLNEGSVGRVGTRRRPRRTLRRRRRSLRQPRRRRTRTFGGN